MINVTGFGQISENSVMALDQIFHSANPSVPPGSVLPSIPVNERSNEIAGYEGYKLSSIGYPHLTYYHRIPLIEHPTSNRTKPGQQVKTTWYIPDSNNPELSALRYSINFKKGGFRHYEQKFYIDVSIPKKIDKTLYSKIGAVNWNFFLISLFALLYFLCLKRGTKNS